MLTFSTVASPITENHAVVQGSLWRPFLLGLYDHLGTAVAINLMWLAASVPWLAGAAACAALGGTAAVILDRPGLQVVGLGVGGVLVSVSPPTLFAVVASAPWVHGEESDLRSATRLACRRALRAQVCGLGLAAAVGMLLVNALFYRSLEGWPGLLLSSLMLWLAVVVLLLAVYLLPLLSMPDAASPLRQLLRDSAFLAIDNPRFTLGLVLALVVSGGAAAVSGLGLALGGVTAMALLLNLGLARALARYGGRPLQPDGRGWRDLLQPWR
jgi:uncharacterized membrane protein YesL